MTLHGQLQATFPAQGLAGVVFRGEGGIGVDVALVLCILDERGGTDVLLGARADVVDNLQGFAVPVAALDECLGTHEHHVGIAQHVVVLAEGLPGVVVELALRALRNLLHRAVVAVGAGGAAVGGVQRVLLLVFIGIAGHADGVEQARVVLVGQRGTGLDDGVVVGIEVVHRQTVAGLEGVHQVLRGLVEVPAAGPYLLHPAVDFHLAPHAVQHVRPVGAAEGGAVVRLVGVLHGKDALLRVGIVLQEDVSVGVEIAVVGVLHHLGVLQHLLYLLLVNVVIAGGGLVAVAVGPVEIALGQIGGSSHLVGTAGVQLAGLVGFDVGQMLVGKLEVVDDVLHDGVVRALRR